MSREEVYDELDDGTRTILTHNNITIEAANKKEAIRIAEKRDYEVEGVKIIRKATKNKKGVYGLFVNYWEPE